MTDSVERFGSRAAVYAAYRPSYPIEAIDAVMDGLGDPNGLSVADVGAGTGISSRIFAQRGATVYAIEPNASMRAAATPHPRVHWHDGTAERTGLSVGSVDIAVACQAFHWFSTHAAMQEFRRIARCRAAIVQYERDESDAFTAKYGDVVRAYARDDTEALRARGLTAFATFPQACISSTRIASVQRLDCAQLLGRASSASYLPDSGPSADLLRRDLAGLFKRFAHDGVVELALQTLVMVAKW